MANSEKDLASKIAELEAKNAELSKTVEILAKHSGPAITALRNEEFDRMWGLTKKIADLPNAIERVKEMMAIDPQHVKRTVQHMSLEVLAATVDACNSTEKARIWTVLAEETKLQLTVRKLPPPKRVRISLRDAAGALATREVRGATRSQNYGGFRLVGPKYIGDAVGPVFKILPLKMWTEILAIDVDLTMHIANGDVLVEAVDDATSSMMLLQEVRDSNFLRGQRSISKIDEPYLAQAGTFQEGVNLLRGDS